MKGGGCLKEVKVIILIGGFGVCGYETQRRRGGGTPKPQRGHRGWVGQILLALEFFKYLLTLPYI